jgi:nitrate reductase gamma subunit
MDKVKYVSTPARTPSARPRPFPTRVLGADYNHRGSISPWIRSLHGFQPDPSLMSHVPFVFQLHVPSATALFHSRALCISSRHRSATSGGPTASTARGRRPRGADAQRARRGWEQSELPKTRHK